MSSQNQEQVRWNRVSLREPCTYCERGDERCARSADGRFAVCYRHNDGTAAVKRSKDGFTYYRYDLRKGDDLASTASRRPYLRVVPDQKRAEPETLHRVYEALLKSANTKLTQANRDSL